MSKYFPKLGDLELNTTTKQHIDSQLENILGTSSYLNNYVGPAFYEKYRFRYLFTQNYSIWQNQFNDWCGKIRPEARLRAEAYGLLNPDWILKNTSITTAITGTNTQTTTTNGTNTNTQTTTDTSVKNDSNQRTGTITHNYNSNTATTYNTTDTTTFNTTDKTTGSDRVDVNSSTDTKFIDNSKTTTTNNLEDSQIGVKTTANTPAADTVSKTITTNIVPPMNAVDGVGGQGENPTIHSDNITSTTPFEVGNNGYLSGAVENITYNNLQREENGNYKRNITTETYGEINSETGLYEGLKNQHTGSTTTEAGRTEEHIYNTEQSVDTTGDTTTTYNSQQAKTGTEATAKTGTETTGHNGDDTDTYAVTDTRIIQGKDDATHNLEVYDTGNNTSTATLTGQNSSSTTADGFSQDRSLLYMNFIDAINKSDFVDWFVGQFWHLFSVAYELDERDIFDLEAWNG